jgi:uncharacterized protein DUF4349
MENHRTRRLTGRAPFLVVMILAALLLAACATPSSTESGGRSSAVAPSPEAPAVTDGALGGPVAGNDLGAATPEKGATPSPGGVQKLIVVNKTMRVETSDVDASIAKIRALTAASGGDISSMQVSTATDEPIYPMPVDGDKAVTSDMSVPLRAYVVVRVPTASYKDFVAEIAKLGRVLFQSESADDVTQQHVDMKARLGNLQAEQGRLRQLFARANNVRDMLAIERELTRVQGEIESLQAQIGYLEKQAAMATVTIELAEPKPLVRPTGTDWGVGAALTESIRAFVETLNTLIVILGPAVALLIFVGLPAWLIVRLVRGRMRRGKPAPPTDAA